MKLNITKIKELKTKTCYFYEKKRLFKKKLFAKSNKDNERINQNNEETRFIHCERS